MNWSFAPQPQILIQTKGEWENKDRIADAFIEFAKKELFLLFNKIRLTFTIICYIIKIGN
jgi:hypothetical protein